MNKVMLVGRLTRDPEMRNANGKAVARFSVAVNRPFKNANGDYDVDFPNCTAWDKTAEFIGNYFKKGMMIGICGRLQTGSYTNKDGATVYTTDVVVENAEFVERKSAEDTVSGHSAPAKSSKSAKKQEVEEEPEETSVDDYPF